MKCTGKENSKGNKLLPVNDNYYYCNYICETLSIKSHFLMKHLTPQGTKIAAC